MKTRIVYPQMWLDEKFAECAPTSKLLFCYLINNSHLKLTRYLHITDRQIKFDTGLSTEQLSKGKEELSSIKWVYFAENWVFHNHGAAYVDYDGRDRVLSSKEEELASVPEEIKDVFKGLVTGYKPVLIHKPEIINPKPGVVKGETKVSYLREIPQEDMEEFPVRYNANRGQISLLGEQLALWCESSGKTKKNYRSFLQNRLLDKYGLRVKQAQFNPQEAAPDLTPEQQKASLERLAQIRQGIKIKGFGGEA